MSVKLEDNQTMAVDVDELNADAESSNRDIAGYVLQERIGAGGYGEVWRAIGPGGLPKAVKILHGNFDGPTADSELKSLKLMRELRHPFLLSIERIETHQNRVVVVTELAECSLEDRFTEALHNGNKGLPRDELIGYMRDAADALDFLHQQHGLQHLDIKPGNLLIQGGHAKVADFGLMKDIRKTNISVIGGFTPLYAPPELFEGEPSSASDQYSLAIVFQLMLTGIPPFGGRTAAQLTAQHLRSKPDLSALSPSDRSVIARALSKNVAARFPSCREFVDKLSTQQSSRASTPQNGARRAAEQAYATTPDEVQKTVTNHVKAVECSPCTPIELQGPPTAYRPALFVGVGGLAGEVLLKLRNRLSGQFGHSLPAYNLLYLDTDPRAIRSVGYCSEGEGLDANETLQIPLREPNHYRSRSKEVLDWISRRWLFNIPRSRQVEGLRPLGRLAFVDHHEEIREHLRTKVANSLSAEAISATEEILGAELADKEIDVFVVSSISGGAGSGAVLDLGYLIRDLLQSSGIEVAELTGVLLHSTSQKNQQSRLQRANTLACLTEFKRFSTPHLGYPGASACQLSDSDIAPFNNTYLIHLGDQIGDSEFEQGTANVAEYLFQQTTTPSREFFLNNRADDPTTDDSRKQAARLSTFGVAAPNDADRADRSEAALALSRGLLRKWKRGAGLPRESSPSANPQISEFCNDLLRKSELDVDQIVRKVTAISGGGVGKQIQCYFASKFDLANCNHALFATIEHEFATTDLNGKPNDHPAIVISEMAQQLTLTAHRSVEQISMQILLFSDQADQRLDSSCQCISDMMHRLKQTHRGLAEMLTQTDGERAGLARRDLPEDNIRECMQQYITLCFCSGVLRSLCDYVNEIHNILRDFGASLMQTISAIPDESEDDVSEDGSQPLVDLFDQQLREDATVQLDELFMAARISAEMPRFLIDRAAEFLDQAAQQTSNSNDNVSLTTFEEQAKPILTDVGGYRRVLAVSSKASTSGPLKKRLEQQFGPCVTLDDRQTNADTFVCCEVSGLQFDLVAEQIMQGDPTVADTASRIHSRIDVAW